MEREKRIEGILTHFERQYQEIFLQAGNMLILFNKLYNTSH